MNVEFNTQEFVLRNLKTRIDEPALYSMSIVGKKLRREFQKLTGLMQGGDELWEYEWFGNIGPRPSYSMGWCVVRGEELVASHLHSSS